MASEVKAAAYSHVAMLEQLSLDGTWRIRWSDGQRGRAEHANQDRVDEGRYIDAQVPGEVHLDVWRASCTMACSTWPEVVRWRSAGK